MATDDRPHSLALIGLRLAMAGAGVLAAIFAIVLISGGWPEFLTPVRNLFGFIASWVGGFAIVVEFWLFAGPGTLLYLWAKR